MIIFESVTVDYRDSKQGVLSPIRCESILVISTHEKEYYEAIYHYMPYDKNKPKSCKITRISRGRLDEVVNEELWAVSNLHVFRASPGYGTSGRGSGTS
jgi:hypothetical protein